MIFLTEKTKTLSAVADVPDSLKKISPGSNSTVYFPALDGLRAFCVFFVILVHTKNRPSIVEQFPGFLGVDIFFVLSGFLITYFLRQEYIQSGTICWRTFYLRRLFRIVPIYAAVLLAYALMCRVYGGDKWAIMKSELPYFLTFMNEFNPVRTTAMPFSYSWTLGVEEKFYLLWPVLFFILFRSTRLRNAVAVGAYFVLVAAAPLLQGTARSYSGLLVGCFLGVLLTGPFATNYVRAMRRVPTIIPFVLFLCGFYLVHIEYWFILVFSWITFFFVGELVLKESWLSRLLSFRVLVWLGKRSYGMYLLQGICLNVVQGHLHFEGMLSTVATCSLAAVLSEVTYKVIEIPSRNLGKTLIAGLRQSSRHVVQA